MEYERIHKVQVGIISPTKLRMKLLGPHHHRKPDGSNCNSSRTSPSKLDDTEFVKNSLLAPPNGDYDEEDSCSSVTSHCIKASSEKDSFQSKELQTAEKEESGGLRTLQLPREDGSSSNAIHPMKMEDENLDYDSNASSSSFEFHKGERPGHSQMTRSLSRPMSSKWNNAEKWILGRQNGQPTHLKKNSPQNSGYRFPISNMVKVAPESANSDLRLPSGRVGEVKRVEFFQPGSHMGFEKFSFTSSDSHLCGRNMLFDPCSQSKDLEEVDDKDFPEPVAPSADATGIRTVRSVSMRDMGTEMTPATSLEPSRTATPMGASPLRSPTSSIPSTPRKSGPASIPVEETSNEELKHPNEENSNKELSEEEVRLKTRREIVALGVQLGKTNIAAWASENEQEKKNRRCAETAETAEKEELKRLEFEKRAISWEEVEKSKHMARLKREEIKIQVWESQQKAKLEAEMQNIEAQVEQMRAQAHAKMMKKIELARQRSEDKRAAAEARRNREAKRTAAQTEYIRQTGKIPTSHYSCCGWLS